VAAVDGYHWAIEDSFETTKDEFGLRWAHHAAARLAQ
jgi:hypothetical protein